MRQGGDGPGDGGSRKSIIACHSCRRRKIKCDREYPSCQICLQTGQECNYPPKPKKPGPKIGSLQRQKRRYQGRHMQNRDQHTSSKSFSPSSYAEEDLDMTSAVDIEDGEETFTYQQDTGPRMAIPASDGNANKRNSKLSINSLSFILHPSHEASPPGKDPSSSTAKDTPDREKQGLIQQASHMLGLSQEMMQFMIQVYFNNMVAINLFHEPTFTETIGNFATPIHVCALVAAMCGFAAKFYTADLDAAYEMEFLRAEAASHSPNHFLAMALKFVDEAIVECDDDPPPICVVQALIVTTHCHLTRGVHGKAWRLLGSCVRLAYELNLHLVDALEVAGDGPEDATRWRDAEEKRRAWWAIWEMDVFASTIRRTPTGIAWAHMETLLPVDDVDWFQCRPAPSAFMEPDPVQRWKALQETGNHSPKAWFLVINSLMKDAQIISSPRGVPFHPSQGRRQRAKSFCQKGKGPRVNLVEESRQKLAMLANSVQCFVLALPQHLKYRNRYLGFDPPVAAQVGSMRQLHCDIYNIYVMTQLARLMIHRYDMFGSHTQSRQSSVNGNDQHFHPGDGPVQNSPAFQDPDNPSVSQYFEAADNILMIVNRSCENHIQHINPFLPSTIWLAAAAQLVRNYINTDNVSPGLIKSRFDVLYLTYKRCVEFWDTKTAMEQNLESLEMQLEGHQPQATEGAGGGRRTSLSVSGKQNGSATPVARRAARASANQPKVSEERHDTTNINQEPSQSNMRAPTEPNHSLLQFMPNSPPATVASENCASNQQISPLHGTAASSRPDYLELQGMTLPPGEAGLAASRLDFVQMVRSDGRLMMRPSAPGPSSLGTPGGQSGMMNAAFYYGQGLEGLELQQDLEQRSLELPMDVHDVLSGLTTY